MSFLEFSRYSNTDNVKSMYNNVVAECEKVYDRVVNLKEKRNFNNTVRPLINVDDFIQPFNTTLDLMGNVHPDKEVRDTCLEYLNKLEQFNIQQSMRKDIYNAVMEMDKENLDNEDSRYLEHLHRDFKRLGLHINDDRIEQLRKQLVELETSFSNNINNVNTKYTFTPEELTGTPSTWFDSHKLENGKYTVTLKYPDYNPIMSYCSNRDVRKKMYCGYNSRCFNENQIILKQILEIRCKLAKLLGYANHADYATEPTIVKSSIEAITFLQDLNSKFTPLYEKEKSELLKFAHSRGFSDSSLQQWDIGYYSRMYKESECNIDLQELRSYFTLKSVKDGMFNIYEKILGLKFTRVETNNLWFPSVELYRVDSEGSEIGNFYLDLYPREGKYSHAAVFPLTYGFDSSKNPYYSTDRVLPLCSMVCNFPENEPLSHGDVTTLFHEFGHVMHIICSRTKLSSFSSFNVESDFVEAPSQMLEYWCLDYECLSMMSIEKNGSKISKDLVDKLNKVNKMMAGHHNKRQLFFGILDLYYHTQDTDNEEIRIVDSCNKIMENVLQTKTPEGTCFATSFGHIVGGYDARYYGYLRAETYAANMYYKIFKGNELNPKMGIRYRNIVLEQSASKDSIDVLVEFLGEEPSNKWFLIDKGIYE